MRTRSRVKIMKTACGKTISYLETEGQANKMHSVEGPALVHADQDSKAPEYYLYGIKYTKAGWKEVLNQHKPAPATEAMMFDSPF